MAGGQERILKRRITSVQSTKKITRAMELIAASRIVKAQAAVQAAVPYSEHITEVVRDLAAAGGGVDSPLLQPRPEVKKVAHVVIAADRGLAGAYNSSVIRAAEGSVKEQAELGRDYGLVLVGRKVEGYFRYRDYRIDAVFSGFSDRPTYEDARAIGREVTRRFLDGEYDRVELVYTRFVSAGVQEVVRRPLVPLEQEVVAGGDARPDESPAGATGATYEFEPSPGVILDRLLPRYVEARIYAALLNAAASEHAARQRAMKAATDNADELIKSLTRVMNRARQDAITTEIMEIVGGAEALRSTGDLVSHDLLSDTIENRKADLFGVHDR
jgi:F-type H+-transporting ATPase subunit gamma